MASIVETAAQLGMHPITVQRLVKSGKIPGKKVRNVWNVDQAAIDSFLAREAGQSPLDVYVNLIVDRAPELSRSQIEALRSILAGR